MKQSIVFLIVTLIISGCGMMGSGSKRDTTLASEDTVIDLNSTDANLSDTNGTILIADNSNSSMGEEESSILPQTISIEFPDILKQNTPEVNSSIVPIIDNNLSSDDGNISTDGEDNITEGDDTVIVRSIAYQQLKKNIKQIEDVVKIAQVNLILLEEVMPQVMERCEGMISCVFEPKFLYIVLDNRTISKIDAIIDDANFTLIDEYNNSKLYLGEITFTKNSVDDGENYELTLDMLSNDEVLNSFYKEGNRTDENGTESDVEVSIKDKNKNIVLEEYQTFKWNSYNSDVITTYRYIDTNSSINISIYYLTDEDGKATMHVYNTTSSDNVKENMNLTLAHEEDDNRTLKLQTNSIEEEDLDGNKTRISSFSSNGELSDSGGLLIFSGVIADSDKNVTTYSELLCNSGECEDNNSSDEEISDSNISDINTSDVNISDINISDNNISEDNISDINSSTIKSDMATIRDNIRFYQLRITDINLTDGSFILLPPYTDITGLKLIDIFGLTLGTFTIFEGKAQGEIHNNSYNDMLNELTIIRIKNDEDNNSTTESMFEVIPEDKRPTIELLEKDLK